MDAESQETLNQQPQRTERTLTWEERTRIHTVLICVFGCIWNCCFFFCCVIPAVFLFFHFFIWQ